MIYVKTFFLTLMIIVAGVLAIFAAVITAIIAVACKTEDKKRSITKKKLIITSCILLVVGIILMPVGIFAMDATDQYGLFDEEIVEMRSYMKDKYQGESYSFVEFREKSYGPKEVSAIFSADDLNGEPVYVSYTVDGDEVEIFDNYLAVKYRRQTKAMLDYVVKDAFGENFYLAYNVSDSAYTLSGDRDTDFTEFCADETSEIEFSALVNYETSEENKKEILKKVQEAFEGKAVSGIIYFVNDGVDYTDEGGKELAQRIIKKGDYDRKLRFGIKNDGEFEYSEWG